MLSFAAVVRNQPNKYVNGWKNSTKQEAREESVDYGFFDCNFETDGQDPEEAWANIGDSYHKDKPYDCYVGSSPSTKTRPSDSWSRGWKSFDPHLAEVENFPTFSTPHNSLPGPPEENHTQQPSADLILEEIDGASENIDSYILINSLHEKFKKCIDLVKNVSSKKDVLVIVDGKTTEVSLMVAFLCLSGVTAGTAGQSSAAVQVATRDELKKIKRHVDLVINFSMFSSLKELSERAAVLSKDGDMKTLFMDTSDKEKAEKFAEELFKCGLSVPFELESYLV